MADDPPVFCKVVIPTFNRCEALRQTLETLMPQIAGLSEVVVHVYDNASTDNTDMICTHMAACNPLLMYTRNPKNLGIDGSVLRACENARSSNIEYLIFLADDDIVCDGGILGILTCIRAFRPVVVISDWIPDPFQREKKFLNYSTRCEVTPKNSSQFYNLATSSSFIPCLTVSVKDLHISQHVRDCVGTSYAHVSLVLETLSHNPRLVFNPTPVVIQTPNREWRFDFRKTFIFGFAKSIRNTAWLLDHSELDRIAIERTIFYVSLALSQQLGASYRCHYDASISDLIQLIGMFGVKGLKIYQRYLSLLVPGKILKLLQYSSRVRSKVRLRTRLRQVMQVLFH